MSKENNNLIFGNLTTFAKAFPEINDLKIQITESVGNDNINQIIINKKNFRENIKCSKSGCFEGGVEIGNIVREMIYKKLKEKEDSFVCKGKISSPKGQRIYGNGKCWNQFDYKIVLDYK